MSLTLKVEQRLIKFNMIKGVFDPHKGDWKKLARKTYLFVKDSFPPHAAIRKDDVAKSLCEVLEVNEILKTALAAEKQKQNYWIRDFADLIIDRLWDDISN